MALPVLLGAGLKAGGEALMKQSGKVAASKLMGRKTRMQPGKAQTNDQEVGGERGALAVRPKTSMVSVPPALQSGSQGTSSASTNPLESINASVIEIKSILKGTLAAEKKEQENKEKEEQRAARKKQETKLETKKTKEKTKVKMPSAPRMGLLGWISNFITNTILGFFAVRLVEYIPQLLKIVNFIAPIGEFLVDVGIKLIDGFATFIDAAYGAYDWTRDTLETFGGEKLVGAFDGIMKAVEVAITVLTFALGARSLGGFGGGGSGVDKGIPKGTKPGAVRKYIQRFGRDAAIQRFGKDAVSKFGGSAGRSTITKLARQGAVATLGKGGTKATLKFVKKFISPVVKRIPIIGGLIDFALNYFVFKEPVGRAAFAAIGSTIFGALGATAGSVIPIAGNFVGGALGALAGDVAGKWLYDTFFAKKKPVEVGDRDSSLNKSKGSRDSSVGYNVAPITSLGSGGGSLKDMTDQDFSDLAFIVSAEAARNTDDEYGVAAAVLNRVADSRYPNTIMGVGTAPGQFEAVFNGKAYRDPELAEKLKNNQGKIVDALKKLNGRTDFKGQSMLQYMGSTDIMFANKGNFYHYAEQKGKTDPIPSSIPQDWKKLLGESTGQSFTPPSSAYDGQLSISPSTGSSDQPTTSSDGGDISVSGSNIVNIGKDLVSEGFSVAEHPDFTKTPTASGGTYTPGEGSVSNVHKGAGHYEGRAIDVTDWRGSLEDSKARYRSVLTSLQDNPAIKMLIHDSWGGMYAPGQKQGPGGHGHPTHMHIEVKDKGGFVGKGLFANLGDPEFVMDADSTAALKQVAPGLQMALNQARDSKGIESALQQYASYDSRAEQTVMVPQPAPQQQEAPQYGSSSMMNIASAGRSQNFSEFLDFQG